MKLKCLKIKSPFRNLSGLVLDFNQKAKTYVLIGNNGAGKSSLLEALSSIFNALYAGENGRFEFDFELTYEIEGMTVEIIHDSEEGTRFSINKKWVDHAVLKNMLPQRVICNYSGEEMRINQAYYEPLRIQHEQALKSASGGDMLHMVFVGKELWKIILCIMLAHRKRYASFDTFLNALPGKGKVEHIEMDVDQKALDGWSANPVSYFMRRLSERVQPNGVIAVDDLNPSEYEASTMFNNLSGAHSLMKHLRVAFPGGIDSDYLSEGEKKWMVVLFVLEVLSSENSLVLLDEPDSHIHVARKKQMAALFQKAINRENVITSHSPTLTAAFEQNAIVMLEGTSGGFSRVVDADKQKVVAKLTDGIWSLQQQNHFLASNNDILLVEGVTDETFLEKALQTFQGDERFMQHKYEMFPCGGADGIVSLRRHFHPKDGQTIFGFFDNDDAGWKGLNTVFCSEKSNRFSHKNFGLARKIERGIWIAPYPCSQKRAGNFNIEDYFPRRIFLHHILSFRNLNTIISKKSMKDELAKDCKNGIIQGKDFTRFSVVFELIEAIKKADAEGKEQLMTWEETEFSSKAKRKKSHGVQQGGKAKVAQRVLENAE